LNDYRKRFKQVSVEAIRRRKANYQVHKALLKGNLSKLPCWVCGDKKVEGHHVDYDSPLDVIWLCRKHHCEVHGKSYR